MKCAWVRTRCSPEAPSAWRCLSESKPSVSAPRKKSSRRRRRSSAPAAPASARRARREISDALTTPTVSVRADYCQRGGGVRWIRYNPAALDARRTIRAVRRIWRAAVEAVTPYEAGKPLEMLVAELGLAELVRLSANENPLGPSPRAVEAVRREAHNIHLYPDGGSAALRDALAHNLGISPEPIVLGNRPAQLITLIALAPF